MKLKLEKKDGIDVVVYADCSPGWSRPASPDEVVLWNRIVELEAAQTPASPAPERPARFLTQEHARLLCDAHDVDALLANDDQADLLERHNPKLLHAYTELQAIADGSD